ncbi:TPA: hypothetical protein ENS27_07890 [bacterium]|nr:hypothetical protein [bacterium]
MSKVFLFMIFVYLLEIINRINAFKMPSSKLIWLAGGALCIAICYMWCWISSKRQRRNSFVMIIGLELFFIGTSLLGFGIAYIFIPEKNVYSSIAIWPIGIFINSALAYFRLFIDYVGLQLIPLTIMICIPIIGCSMILLSYPLCFEIETQYWPRIAVACSVYAIANVLDYLMTINGIMSNISREGNPLVQKYIDRFGLLTGVFLHKLIMFIIITTGVIILSYRYSHDHKNIVIPESILYWGSAITLIAVALWLKLFG